MDEWTPEPLAAPLTATEQADLIATPTIVGPTGPKPKLLSGKTVINLASYNFAGLAGNETIKERAIDIVRKYGLGSCGPPGFYGTQGEYLSVGYLTGSAEVHLHRRPHSARAGHCRFPGHGGRHHLLAGLLHHIVRDPRVRQAWRYHRCGPWRQFCYPERSPNLSVYHPVVRPQRHEESRAGA